MTVLVGELINDPATFEVVRDQIAQILANNVAEQQRLAAQQTAIPALWGATIYTERANPWSLWPEAYSESELPIVNVCYFSSKHERGDPAGKASVNVAKYNIDCLVRGRARDDSRSGHVPSDLDANLRVQRVAGYMRKILMSAVNTQLGMRGTVGRRWISQDFTYQLENQKAQADPVGALRLELCVQLEETAPQSKGVTLVGVDATVERASNGEVLAKQSNDFVDPEA